MLFDMHNLYGLHSLLSAVLYINQKQKEKRIVHVMLAQHKHNFDPIKIEWKCISRTRLVATPSS